MDIKDHITSQSEIPVAYAYVCTTDRFMSGWGPAEGRNNRLIFVCHSPEDVEAVFDNAEARDDQKLVTFCRSKPRLDNSRNFYQLKDRKSSESWYVSGYFSR